MKKEHIYRLLHNKTTQKLYRLFLEQIKTWLQSKFFILTPSKLEQKKKHKKIENFLKKHGFLHCILVW